MEDEKYHSTINKDRVRNEDTKLVLKKFQREKRGLSYLGLPSGEMKDILEWKDYLSRYTAVERELDQRHRLELTALKNNLQDNLVILFGDLDNILVKGGDKFGNKLEFPYDIVFLDYYGGIIYRGFRRIRAINSLIEKQKLNHFLLLMTFNLEESSYARNERINVLGKIKDELLGFYPYDTTMKEQIEKIIEWHKSEQTPEFYRQKIFVPYLIKTNSEMVGFKVHSYPPLFYKGFKDAPMIHFAFKLIPEGISSTKAVSEQTILDIINLNLKQVENGRISIMKHQAPHLIFNNILH
jgi:hypothetical protein